MDDENGNGLAASVQAAWGLRVRPAKGPKPALTLERIVVAAVRIADTDGLAAVSMSKVAAEVGVTAMALYRYVGNKDELLALMVDAAMGAPPKVPRPDQGWRAGLTEWAWAIGALYRAKPWALRVPITGIPALPNQFAWMDRGLACLSDCGLDEEDQLSTILLISNLARVYEGMVVDLTNAFQAAGGRPDEVMAQTHRTFVRLATPERFPALSKVIATGVLSKADPMDKEFIFGLERVLDGVGALIARAESQ